MGKGAGVVVAAFALVPVLIIGGLIAVVVLLGGQSAAAACGQGAGARVDVSTVGGIAVPGYSSEQLGNAAAIMNAAAALGLSEQAQQIGVMTALGESGLRVLNYGDGAINPDGSVADSVGLFQQQHSWGTLAQRLDPATSATFFFQRLMGVPNWQSLTPTQAAHAVQVNADPDFYTKYVPGAVAIVQALSGVTAQTASSCTTLSGNDVALAQELMFDVNSGKLVGSTPDHIKEIRDIANGLTVPNCGVDTGVLQIIVVAVRNFEKVGVSDINRLCTGQIEGAGTLSAHYAKGGGHAVDFYMLNGQGLTGRDSQSLKLIQILDPIVSHGDRIGQSECGSIPFTLINFSTFDDTCTHLHVDDLNAVPTATS